MSAIHDLISQVTDPRLRERLAAEWAKASQEKKFGLVFDHHMEIAPKSASHNAPAPLAPSISRQRTLHRESSNFHRWGQMHVCHLAEH